MPTTPDQPGRPSIRPRPARVSGSEIYYQLTKAGMDRDQAQALADRAMDLDRDHTVPISIKLRLARAGAGEIADLVGICDDRQLARDLRAAVERHPGLPKDDLDRIGWLQARLDDLARAKARELGVG